MQTIFIRRWRGTRIIAPLRYLITVCCFVFLYTRKWRRGGMELSWFLFSHSISKWISSCFYGTFLFERDQIVAKNYFLCLKKSYIKDYSFNDFSVRLVWGFIIVWNLPNAIPREHQNHWKIVFYIVFVCH